MTKAEYQQAISELAHLVAKAIREDKEEARLDVLKGLIEQYERRQFVFEKPDAVEAIEFRMEQLGLSRRDLEPLLGGPSRVSEILNRRRPLSLSMIRALHTDLKIPAEVLIQKSELIDETIASIGWDWTKFPLDEMCKRGWIPSKDLREPSTIDSLMRFFYVDTTAQPSMANFRRTRTLRSARQKNDFALFAWISRIKNCSEEIKKHAPTYQGGLNKDTMLSIAKLSSSDDGPLRAQKRLHELGIILIIESHLSKTYLDGASIVSDKNNPVIGMTIRHDRLNNFWFTLMHELAHIFLHSQDGPEIFVDDLEKYYSTEMKEKEADDLASEILIPSEEWEISPARAVPSVKTVRYFAASLGIHAAIVAGYIQHKADSYYMFKNLVGNGEVRKHFPEVEWN